MFVSKTNKTILLEALLLCLSFLCLAGCMATHASANEYRFSDHTGQYYLSLAESAPPELRSSYMLEAAQAFLRTHHLLEAKQSLAQTHSDELDAQQQIDFYLAAANLSLLEHQPNQSLEKLRLLETKPLNDKQLLQRYEITAQAFEHLNHPMQSVAARITLSHLLTTTDQIENNQQAIWTTLQTLALNTLAEQEAKTQNIEMKAWLQLALIAKVAAQDPEKLAAKIAPGLSLSSSQSALIQLLLAWKQRYPEHPANQLLPNTQTMNVNQLNEGNVEHIALFLPVTGPFAKEGNAVKNGFMASYYQTQPHRKLEISIFDTNKQTPEVLYKQAIASGAELIVGPLRKPVIVDFIHHVKPDVPVLLLNETELTEQLDKPFFTFSLSPLDEIKQLVETMQRTAYTRTLLIYPADPWGENLAERFKQAFRMVGGNLTDALAYDPNNTHEYAADIAKLLRFDQSEGRKAQLEKMLKVPLEFIPSIRQDSDSVFLIATPQAARQIKPLLKFYYAGTLRIFGLSNLYTGALNERLDRDLNGIVFCDIPWLVNPTPAMLSLQRSLKSLWPDSFKQAPRLYALGADAYQLAAENQLNLLSLLPHFGSAGNTGFLTLTGNRINRKLQLAILHQGKVTSVLQD